MTQAQQVKIFCSYAHEDQLFIHHLKTHFALLERLHPWVLWTDAEIHAGEEWEQTIQEHLDTAQIILLLVSPDFIASDYCYSKEMVRAMERHEQKEAYVIPILIRHVAQQWKNTPLGKLQALPADGKPITDRYWHTTDAALCHVVEKISQVISLHARGNEASTTGRVAIQAESEQPDTVTSQLLKPQPLSHFLAQSGSIQIERAGIKIFEHQQDAYDFLSQIIHRNGAKEAVLFQYSCQTGLNVLRLLLRAQAEVTVFIQHEDTAKKGGSQFQADRIIDAMRDLRSNLGSALSDPNKLKVYKYRAPCSFSAIKIDNQVLYIGLYTYEHKEQGSHPNYPNDITELSGHDRAAIVAWKGLHEFQTSGETFSILEGTNEFQRLDRTFSILENNYRQHAEIVSI